MKNIAAAALIAACLHALGWYAAHETSTPPDVPGMVDSMSFTVGTPRESWFGPSATSEDVERALAAVSPVTRTIRTYSTAGIMAEVPARARKHGVEVQLGIWLGRDAEANRREIETGLRLIGHNPNITTVVVGNETMLRRDMTEAELIGYIREIRSRTNVKVTTGETWDAWLAHPNLAKEVDMLGVHVLPYWEAIPSHKAVEYTFDRFRQVTEAFPTKRAYIAEFGWPSRGYNNKSSDPDPLTQAEVIRSFITEAHRDGVAYNLMEAFDQPWKTQEGSVGPYWGIFNKDYLQKFELNGLVVRPDIERRGVLALILGVLITAACLYRRRPLFGQAMAVAVAANALAAAVAVGILYPVENYLNFGSALAWLLGLLLMVPLTMVTLSKVNEVAEVTLGRQPTRLWRGPAANTLPLRQPKVSVHIPAYREQPEMLIETLESVSRLDYPDFEVLVIVNNTPEEHYWKPVEKRCRELGPRFKFLNFPKVAGFKAGAMNAAMEHMAEDAEIIALLDADYVVASDWLKDLVPAFADPKIALVQAPQDHRDGNRSTLAAVMNAEYTGFFDIGMVQRNESDAIVAHGTMLLLRRRAFEEVGGWTTDTITEDTELGLRLYEAGYASMYTRRRYGWGLLPGTYQAFKTQRHRWAYGAVQIIKKHWRHMLPSSTSLRREQKMQFITGWFHWLSDAVGALAAVVNLAWVPFILFVGVMLPPIPFTLPIIASFLAGLLHCFLLYGTRVRIGPKAIAGAALAAASLQWTVARAVYDGLRYDNLPFRRTAKGAGSEGTGLRAAFSNYRQRMKEVATETWLGCALVVGSLIVFAANTTAVFEIKLFATTLMIQSVPFLATSAMNYLERQENARAQAAAAARDAAADVAETQKAAA